ncbi:hypothetical protein M8J76_012626 [Diaphorina citri]|nr:hypothetical protein M8J77_015889 [Diaphorina citri]KAI5719619.1 hypothetical protein M8J76_012626 [Diaphorina citri]
MQCFGCNGKLPSNGNYVHCNACNEDYHFKCTTLSERSYTTMSKANKLKWKCHECRKNNNSQGDSGKVTRKRNDSVTSISSSELLDNLGGGGGGGLNRSKSMDPMENILSRFEEKLWKKMDKKFNDIERYMEFSSEKMDDFFKMMKELQKKCILMEGEQEIIRQENMELKSKVKSLEAQVQENSQHLNHGNKIEIVGLPATVNNEKETVSKILEKVNGVSIAESNYDMETRKYENRLNVTVQFQAKSLRDKIMKKKLSERKVKLGDVVNSGDVDDTKFVYLNESLSPYYGKLFSEAKKIKRDKNYAHIWVRDGKILLKKQENSRPMQLKCMDDLGKI